MERFDDEVIELGAVSEETKGLGVGNYDTINGHQPAGLTND